jgi:hypothetical protein
MNHDHDNIFYDLIQNMTSDTREPTKTNGSHKHRLISYKKIPFARSDSLYEGIRNFTTENMGSYLLPENDNCIDCEAALNKTVFVTTIGFCWFSCVTCHILNQVVKNIIMIMIHYSLYCQYKRTFS